MDQSTALLTALRNLDLPDGSPPDAGPGGPSLEAALDALTVALSAAVESYHGVEVTLQVHGYPVVLSTLARPPQDVETTSAAPAGEPVTSLRLSLDLLGPQFEPGAKIVIYAVAPGSLVDLAADLSYALTLSGDGPPAVPSTDTHRRDAASTRALVVLDADLPPSSLGPGLWGLSELSSIARAEGVMIGRGHHPDEVSDTLRRQAAAAGLSPHTYAGGGLHGLGRRSDDGAGCPQPVVRQRSRPQVRCGD